jgi:hypothetical protein
MRSWYARSRWARGTVRGWRLARPRIKDAVVLVALAAFGHLVSDVPYYVTALLWVMAWCALDVAVYRLTHPRVRGARVVADDSTGETSAEASGDGAAEVIPGGR